MLQYSVNVIRIELDENFQVFLTILVRSRPNLWSEFLDASVIHT